MPAKPTKLYPIANRFILGVPSAVHVVETRERAEELIATGAFTDNANHAERDKDAMDLSNPEPEPPADPAEE